MRGLNIDGIHTGNDYDLVMNSLEIEEPEYKSEKINVPGGNGELDMTEWLGRVCYENRELNAEFEGSRTRAQWEDFANELRNTWHGRRVKIITDDDPGYYLSGRLSVKTAWIPNRGGGVLKLTADCDPYKLKLQETVAQVIVGEKSTDNLCPAFMLWGNSSLTEANFDTVDMNSYVNYGIASPYFAVKGGTAVTIKASENGRMYVNFYTSSKSSVGSSTVIAAGTNTKHTVTAPSTAAYARITLYPPSTASYPIRYSKLQVYEGSDDRSYVRNDDNGKIIWLKNASMPATPTIRNTGDIRMLFNGVSVNLTSGSRVLHEFTLERGETYIQIVESSSSGVTVEVKYQEGKL